MSHTKRDKYFGRVKDPGGHHTLVSGEVSREEYLRQYPDSVLKDVPERIMLGHKGRGITPRP